MDLKALFRHFCHGMEPRVFLPAAGVVIAFVAFGVIFTDTAQSLFNSLQSATVATFGWFYILTATLLLVFTLRLAAGCYSDIQVNAGFEGLFGMRQGLESRVWLIAGIRLVATMGVPTYMAEARACRDTNVLRFSLIFGLLLMTFPGSPSGASGAQDEDALGLTDFTTGTADLGWYVVNDNVMGGRSEGDFRIAEGELHFAGSTNTDGGGFSSIRTKLLDLDLSPYAGIRLRVKGDGRRYTWRIATDARWRGREIGYWADFETRDGQWHTVDVPFSGFVPRFRGTRLDGPELDPAKIRGMGLMIYDRRDGRFDLRLASVQAFSSPVEQQ